MTSLPTKPSTRALEALVIEAALELKWLTDKAGAECPICDGTTEIDGSGHTEYCLITRLRAATKLILNG